MNVKISRILLCLVAIGLLKVGFLASSGLERLLTPPKASGPQAALHATPVQKQPAVLAVPEALAQDKAKEAPKDAAKDAAPAEQPPKGVTPEDWKVLKEREEALAAKERSLQGLERSLDDKLTELKTLEKKLKAMIAEADVLKDEKVRHLVDVYANMKAKQAAAVLETLEDPLAVKILAGMKGRTAGEILSNVKADRAAKLTEALTRLQMPLEGAAN